MILELVAINNLNILSFFPQEMNEPAIIRSRMEKINKQIAWVYFDGVSQQDGTMYEGVQLFYYQINTYSKFP